MRRAEGQKKMNEKQSKARVQTPEYEQSIHYVSIFILIPLHSEKRRRVEGELGPKNKIISSSASLFNAFLAKLTRARKMDIPGKLKKPINIPAPL